MDLQEAFDAGFDAVKRYVDRSFDEFSATIRSLKERVDSLEGRQPQKGDRGEKGDPGAAGKDGLDGIDGKDGAPGEKGEKGDKGEPGKDGERGEKGDPGDIGPAGPKGEKGDPGEPGPQGAPGEKGIAGKDGKDGRDGADITGGTVDRQGHLILTLSNGETKDFGPVVGRDGVDGKDGAKGEPGLDGKDGRDGLGFDDLDLRVSEDGAFLRFMRGTEVKEFRLPIVLDRGVYSAEKTYRPGDGVTWGGSFWIAQEETTDKPDSGKGWRLAVKKGRDGKDGILKPEQPVKVKV